MVKISCKIKGLDKLNKKVNTIIKNLPQTVEQSVEDILKEMQICAIRLEKGHHEEGILCELVDVSNNVIKGKVYADVKAFPFFMFEHYGTGQYAEMEHIGKTEHFINSGYTEWFIPVSAVDRTLSYPIITINDMQFYIAHGVRANHFMTDAEFETREKNKETIEKQIKSMLKEVCK
jgi:hypothetical protein